MSDSEIIQSAGLIGEDTETGKWGYNLAAIMLLGRDDIIFSNNPAYRTDALLRKVNVERYDDRLIVQTNLIESYDLLMQFAAKHLLDKFYLEDDARISLRSIITREMLVNSLMHREFISSRFARFIIEKDRMYTENANRAVNGEIITPENLTPDSKNPLIAAFFRNIGFADELGSGVRRLYHYVPRYSGKSPEMIDGDIFRIIVPLDDNYSFDAGGNKTRLKGNGANVTDIVSDITSNNVSDKKRTDRQVSLLGLLRKDGTVTVAELAAALMVTERTILRDIDMLKNKEDLKGMDLMLMAIGLSLMNNHV
jgi:ATP-dependent DNA helicase RecG